MYMKKHNNHVGFNSRMQGRYKFGRINHLNRCRIIKANFKTLMTKTLSKLATKRNFLSLIKSISKNPTTNIILND